ncbi:hypothetical protein NL425_27525, partial [Klebsiella pneumoniae]|nr:hypothetical protein [Klebsiella pneumoniae]
ILVVRASGIDTEALKLDGGIAEEKPEAAAESADKEAVKEARPAGPARADLAGIPRALAARKP